MFGSGGPAIEAKMKDVRLGMRDYNVIRTGGCRGRAIRRHGHHVGEGYTLGLGQNRDKDEGGEDGYLCHYGQVE